MAIAILMEVSGVGPDTYDAAIKDLNLGGKTTTGGLFHVAGPMEGGWRVVDVWESQAAFETFMREKLGAVLQQHGVPQPQMKTWPVHNTLRPTGPARAAMS